MQPKSLLEKLSQFIDWHPARILTFSQMVLNLVHSGDVQHHSLCRGLCSTVKGGLERVRRFFANQRIDMELFSRAMVLSTFACIPKMDLILDRTNWKFGRQDINYLVLAARVGEITFPLFWLWLEHRGNSNASHRIELLERFRKAFGFGAVKSLTADREFIGPEWIDYLCQHKVPFLSA